MYYINIKKNKQEIFDEKPKLEISGCIHRDNKNITGIELYYNNKLIATTDNSGNFEFSIIANHAEIVFKDGVKIIGKKDFFQSQKNLDINLKN